MRTAARSPWAVAAAFVAVHAWLVARALADASAIFGDVHLYHWWVDNAFATGSWPVLDYDWVYPVGALVPLLVAGAGPWPYAAGFVGLVLVLNAVALWDLWQARKRARYGAWFWLAFLAFLGPISLGRLDGVIAPLILLAAAAGLRHPRAAAAIATVGAWIKIAPAAIFLSLLVFSRRRLGVLGVGAGVSAVVVGGAVLLGSGARVLSVFGQQGERGLQAEAVFATPFSLARLGGGPNPVYNEEIYTFEVLGQTADATARWLDLALLVAVVAILALAWWARRRAGRSADPTLFLLTAQAVLLALVVFNKVGSPQFVAWLAPVVAVALSARPAARMPWEVPALGLLGAAFLTQLIYPLGYNAFVLGDPALVLAAALRNLILVGLLALAVGEVAALGRRAGHPSRSADIQDSTSSARRGSAADRFS